MNLKTSVQATEITDKGICEWLHITDQADLVGTKPTEFKVKNELFDHRVRESVTKIKPYRLKAGDLRIPKNDFNSRKYKERSCLRN